MRPRTSRSTIQCGEPLETEPQRILRLHVGVVVLEPLVDHGRARDAVALHAIGMLLQQVGDHQRAGLDASAEGADVGEGVQLSRHLHDDRRAARPPLEAEGLAEDDASAMARCSGRTGCFPKRVLVTAAAASAFALAAIVELAYKLVPRAEATMILAEPGERPSGAAIASERPLAAVS